MSLKERIENNPVLLVLGLLVTGFIAGVGVYRALLEMVGSTPSQSGPPVSNSTMSSKLDRALEENKQLHAMLQRTQEDCRVQVEQLENRIAINQANVSQVSNSSAKVLVEEGGGLKVELRECLLKGDKVTCSFSVTSTTKDRGQYLLSSRLIERNGNEVGASSAQFGNSTSEGGLVSASLVRNIPMRVAVAFDVDSDLSRGGISLIELRFDDLTAHFRNIRPE